MDIANLANHRDWIPTIARWHFNQWGILTGAESLDQYHLLLERAATIGTVPTVLVAHAPTEPLGSVSLIANDMTIRPELTPWLAQLFVIPGQRGRGVGAALVAAARVHAQRAGFHRLYLYTSGTLPQFYHRLGWVLRERADYLGKARVVMHADLLPDPPG
jgi:GNAT superfamily N-acetyltransferase